MYFLVKALGLYNFIRGFGWTCVLGNKKNKAQISKKILEARRFLYEALSRGNGAYTRGVFYITQSSIEILGFYFVICSGGIAFC